MIDILNKLGACNALTLECDHVTERWSVTLFAQGQEIARGEARARAVVLMGSGFPDVETALLWLAENAAARYPQSSFAVWWRQRTEQPELPPAA